MGRCYWQHNGLLLLGTQWRVATGNIMAYCYWEHNGVLQLET
jgi:hypothetical protein